MNQKIKTTIITVMLVLPFMGYGKDKVEIKSTDPNFSNKTEVPIDVDLNDQTLEIALKKELVVDIVVTGPDGVAYNKRVNSKNLQQVKVDLQQYSGGDYNIVCTDDKGNIVEGEFFLNK